MLKLGVGDQITILTTVVAEEPIERYRDLAVCEALSLTPCAVL